MKFISSPVPKLLHFRAVIFPVPRASNQIRKRSTSPYSLLWECALLVTVMLNDTHQAATKNELAVNLLKIAYKPNTSHYYSSMKQNDYIRVTFPENLSLQCFRTAALFMVTPKYWVTKSYWLFVDRKSLENVKSPRHQRVTNNIILLAVE